MAESQDISENETNKKRNILAICWAGADRSKYMAEILNQRGYLAKNRGVYNNLVKLEDLDSIGTIIFASPFEKVYFEKNEEWNEAVKRNSIEVRNIDVTQSEDDKVQRERTFDEFKSKIAEQLDAIGFEKYQEEQGVTIEKT